MISYIGYVGPGGLHAQGQFPSCTGGAAGYIDRTVFGAQQMRKDGPQVGVYHTTVPFDTEGMLGQMTAIVLTYLGVVSGRVLVYYQPHANLLGAAASVRERASPIMFRWIVWAIICGSVGLALSHGGDRERGVIPINHSLLSVSCVFVSAATAQLFMVLLYLPIDVYKSWSGTPWIYAGLNGIAMYIMSMTFANFW